MNDDYDYDCMSQVAAYDKEQKEKSWIGREYNDWTVISEPFRKRIGKASVKLACKCRCKCGRILTRVIADLKSRQSKRCQYCRFERQNKSNSGFNALWNSLLYNAKSRNINVNITKGYALSVLRKQEFMCALTGWPILISGTLLEHKLKKETTASIDRINSLLPYTNENIQWVHKDINRIKQNFSSERFIKMCRAVALHDQRKRKVSNQSKIVTP